MCIHSHLLHYAGGCKSSRRMLAQVMQSIRAAELVGIGFYLSVFTAVEWGQWVQRGCRDRELCWGLTDSRVTRRGILSFPPCSREVSPCRPFPAGPLLHPNVTPHRPLSHFPALPDPHPLPLALITSLLLLSSAPPGLGNLPLEKSRPVGSQHYHSPTLRILASNWND